MDNKTKEEILIEELEKKNAILKDKLIEQVGIKQCLEVLVSDHLDQIQSLSARVSELEEKNKFDEFLLVCFAGYIQDCIRNGGEMTFPEQKLAVEAWKQTNPKLKLDNEIQSLESRVGELDSKNIKLTFELVQCESKLKEAIERLQITNKEYPQLALNKQIEYLQSPLTSPQGENNDKL